MHDRDGWMWHDGWGWGWGGWVLMTVVIVAFLVVVITLIVIAVRYLSSNRGRIVGPRPGPTANRAEDVLAERYARGEIDDDEYRERLALLREHR